MVLTIIKYSSSSTLRGELQREMFRNSNVTNSTNKSFTLTNNILTSKHTSGKFTDSQCKMNYVQYTFIWMWKLWPTETRYDPSEGKWEIECSGTRRKEATCTKKCVEYYGTKLQSSSVPTLTHHLSQATPTRVLGEHRPAPAKAPVLCCSAGRVVQARFVGRQHCCNSVRS